MADKIRVLIIDDSALIREFLRETFSADPALEVIGAAADPYFARDKVVKLRPDVITLDIEMPRMDGLTFLDKLMAAYPTPVVMFSSHTYSGAKATLEALARGAVDFVAKPATNLAASLPGLKSELVEKVKTAAQAKMGRLRTDPARRPTQVKSGALVEVAERYSVDAVLPPAKPAPGLSPVRDKVILVGASTGGTVAIERVLTALSGDLPPMAIVQHMPPHFTKAFADRLNALCDLDIQEASDGQRLLPGLVVIAPGGLHLLLQRDAQGFFVQVKDGPPVNRHKPSVDVLFRSATHSAAAKSTLAIIMTGMGDDGAKGLAELRAAGVRTIAQNEATSVVYGMPKAAVELGAAERVLPLEAIPQAIVAHTEGEA